MDSLIKILGDIFYRLIKHPENSDEIANLVKDALNNSFKTLR
jgi:hypothetical protein